jgi:hypothetical protein
VSNYRGISLLSTSYKIVSNILLSRLSPYIDEINGDHQCGLHIVIHNRMHTMKKEGMELEIKCLEKLEFKS